MKTTKTSTETYLITEAPALDPISVYVTNHKPGQGKITIDCYGQAWTAYWGGMSGDTLQKFFVSANNAYIAGKMLSTTQQTDFNEIEKRAAKNGYSISATTDAELAMQASDMNGCFGPNWYMDLPTCATSEYSYLCRIIDAVRQAFSDEIEGLNPCAD